MTEIPWKALLIEFVNPNINLVHTRIRYGKQKPRHPFLNFNITSKLSWDKDISKSICNIVFKCGLNNIIMALFDSKDGNLGDGLTCLRSILCLFSFGTNVQNRLDFAFIQIISECCGSSVLLNLLNT